ncbi:MAG: zinc ribbon domain-containing protein [Acidobacteriota bacterium]|nr:zinc ribbon domain-containing protein [Acidobacteriota bacterium]
MYEYQCQSCGRSFEQLRRMSEADVDLRCPACRSTVVDRLLSTFATGVCGTSGGNSGRFT